MMTLEELENDALNRHIPVMQKEGILEIQGRDIRIADWEKFEMYL